METKKKNEKDRISAVLFIVVFLLVVVIVIMVLKTVDDKRAAQQAQEQNANTQTYQSVDQSSDALVIGTDGSVTPNPYEPVNALPGSGNSGNTGNTGNNGNGGGTGNTGNGGGGGQGTTTQPTTAPANNPAPAPVNNQPGNTNTQPGNTNTQPGNTNTQPGTAAETPTQPAPAEEQPFTPAVIGTGTFVSDSGTWLNIHADWSVKTISTSQIEVTVTVYVDHQSLFTGAIDDSVGIQVDGQYVTFNSPKINYDKNDPKMTELASHTFTVDLAQGESRNIGISVAWGYGGEYGSPKGRVKIDSLECGGTVAVTR